MLHKSFLISMSFGSVITIALIALAKNMSRVFGSAKKKEVFILLFISLLHAAMLFGITYLVQAYFTIFWVYTLVFLVFGIINIRVTHKKFIAQPTEKKYVVALGEVLYNLGATLFVCVISAVLQFYLKDKTFIFYPVLLSGLAFLAPLFFYYTYEAALNIPVTDFPVWEYPKGNVDPPEESPNERVYVIGFEIPKRPFEKKTSFRAKAPENIIMGELFYHFINEYNEEKSDTPIQVIDEKREPIVWWFRLKRKWYQFNKVLDPSQRIRDNFIRENSVIICEQIVQKPVIITDNER